jgi:hypothetical protein
MDNRSKEELKRDGDYTPAYWQTLKEERGWTKKRHGQPHPRKRRESVVSAQTAQKQGARGNRP